MRNVEQHNQSFKDNGNIIRGFCLSCKLAASARLSRLCAWRLDNHAEMHSSYSPIKWLYMLIQRIYTHREKETVGREILSTTSYSECLSNEFKYASNMFELIITLYLRASQALSVGILFTVSRSPGWPVILRCRWHNQRTQSFSSVRSV